MADFDRVESRYQHMVDEAISFGRREHAFYVRAKARWLLDVAVRLLGAVETLAALDVGCGAGLTDRHLGSFGRLEGVDVSQSMIAAARRANPDIDYHVCEPTRLPHADGAFDLAFASCVLHHVDPPDRRAFVREMARVVRSGGLVVVLEHNPLNPMTRLVVVRCAFDEGVVLLRAGQTRRLIRDAGLELAEMRFGLFLPWEGSAADRVERLIRRVPLGAQYYVAGRV